jgi:hypothetical protein
MGLFAAVCPLVDCLSYTSTTYIDQEELATETNGPATEEANHWTQERLGGLRRLGGALGGQ